MRGYLLDSHSFLWYDDLGSQLRAEHRALLDDPANDLYVSMASLWELAIKRSLGKLNVRGNFRQFASALNIRLLPITAEHTEAVERLPRLHKDPFDHMLVAQALVEGLVLVTHDAKLQAYDVPMLRV